MAIYPATMKKDHPEGIFVIEFPDFEEAMVAGRLGKDDPQNIGRKCLFDTIWFRLEEGQAIPAPSELCAGQLAISLDNFTVNDNKIIKDAVLDSFVKTFDESVKKFMQQGAHVNNILISRERQRAGTVKLSSARKNTKRESGKLSQ
jgi:hypothetical protein